MSGSYAFSDRRTPYIPVRDTLWQWYKPRYRTEASEARTLSLREVRVMAQERGMDVAPSLLGRRVKYA